jgi:uncharacterized protein
VPSRFNARTVGDDGRLILWNTYSGAVSVFGARSREQVLRRLAPAGVAEPLDRTATFLRERGFLVRQDAGELNRFRYFYARQQWRTDTLQLILLASEDCNFRCVYCYEKFRSGTMQPAVRQGVRRLIDARAPRLAQLSLSWFGGEPLYGWEAIEELAPHAQKAARARGIQHQQSMTTNGYLLTEERATRLLEWGCTRFQITLDGGAADHDCRRVGRDGSPTHAVILDNLRSLRARGQDFAVAVRVNYDAQSFAGMGSFLEALSEDFGGDERFVLRLRAIGQWGGPNDDALAVCGRDEQREVVEEVRRKAGEVKLRIEGGIRDYARPGAQVCYAARPYSFVVGATGKLMKCTIALDEMEANVVGQLHEDGTMELDEGRLGAWVAPHFESDAACRSCYVLPGCQGALCPLTRIQHDVRSCAPVRSSLKREMRYTLGQPGPHAQA